MKTLTYRGFITEYGYYGDGYGDAVGLSSIDGALINELDEYISGRVVSVRYWISNVEQSKDDLIESFVKRIYGKVYLDNESAYSEYTGYLWTNENLIIGGHDLINERLKILINVSMNYR